MKAINIDAMTRKVHVDNRIPLHFYYRIADNLLKQANIYREEKNLVDLYIILLRFSSLVSETIPCHRDYQVLLPREKKNYRKRLLDVIDELEPLKPVVQRLVDEMNKVHLGTQPDFIERSIVYNTAAYALEPCYNKKPSPSNVDIKLLNAVGRSSSQTSWKHDNESTQMFSSNSMQIENQLRKLSVGLPRPKEETLSRHSILGPNGLRGQWLGPSTGTKVNYPSNADLIHQNSGLNQGEQYGDVTETESDHGGGKYIMESVLSLDDGRWQNPPEPFSSEDFREDLLQVNNIRQPSPPPVLAQVQQAFLPVSPSKVADPRPGPAKLSQDGYQNLHIPVRMMEDFLRLVQKNTAKNLETCGVLAGSLRNREFHITTLLIPKQESTSDSVCHWGISIWTRVFSRPGPVNEHVGPNPIRSDSNNKLVRVSPRSNFTNLFSKLNYKSFKAPDQIPIRCQTMNEEEIFEYQDRLSLFPLGWIHVMLPEAIAIVMAPTDTSSPRGIFHLSDPGGVSLIRNCQQRGFHPHDEPADGSPIYEHCTHVYMNPSSKFEIADLR
ncbi:hypothetical protein IFM89_033450 [Coptis chinensis]|uniref:AMSH-like ubiquitin thioesterase 3 n=1 Tax=Coptis chinensis TaxID=261450 RepID=A0A835I1A4_9MAGN|nr:hypothetical protein IFM89_033450 [Coptis chinensis]